MQKAGNQSTTSPTICRKKPGRCHSIYEGAVNETIYLPDSLESPFSDSFSGNVVMYETISANYNKKLINLDSSYYVYDITGTIVNKNNEIDETKVTAFKTNYNINQDYNFPVVVNFVNGTVTSANSL